VIKKIPIKFPKWCPWLTDRVIRTTTTFADRQLEQLQTPHAIGTVLSNLKEIPKHFQTSFWF